MQVPAERIFNNMQFEAFPFKVIFVSVSGLLCSMWEKQKKKKGKKKA